MLFYPNIDPVIFSLGPLQVRWYGLMYVLGFTAAYFLVRKQILKKGLDGIGAHFENLNLILIICLVAGGRLGYVFFYNFSYYLRHPLEIMATWQGGMSFHGGLLGLLLGGYLFCRRHRLDFRQCADLYVVAVPIGLGLGRLGNFINGELYGRVSNVPWAMVFPGGGPLGRHPSQLYEFLLEGPLLFVILWILKDRGFRAGDMMAFFLIFYGMLRSFAEFFREPDAHLGFIFSSLTMGQLLSGLMIMAGVILLMSRKDIRN